MDVIAGDRTEPLPLQRARNKASGGHIVREALVFDGAAR
jgi:hypothetical protein